MLFRSHSDPSGTGSLPRGPERRVWGQSPGIGYGRRPFWVLSGNRIDEIQRALLLLTRHFLPHWPCDRFWASEGSWRTDRIG